MAGVIKSDRPLEALSFSRRARIDCLSRSLTIQSPQFQVLVPLPFFTFGVHSVFVLLFLREHPGSLVSLSPLSKVTITFLVYLSPRPPCSSSLSRSISPTSIVVGVPVLPQLDFLMAFR